ncbi:MULTISPECIES: DUF7144 family membrane protein [Nocardiopsis]|uniref:DUF7144 domain-containing protein n=1 Tax=Nocardiopsis dassonvillei (strain ATCC 23218 / DSM 43111 / CIP 107115 / JCM 7437 / KCTC 9190 / NBRC 14626 / NCTC 10488 / NRRL B-5397 / IMRU 509) TaxID=446468 RepID=D7B1V4_NOCDD|nr:MULTISPECIES: hypothetical protein [Nocardiopsis]ADH66575.1 conserved hypothetical protein [Nocardiopsis dassonvillei subsp. dassonvillei DSM 43111]APC34889.1 hypothetical protein A9R04_09390 [Nocardiopsis dassonvillei]NKY80959.1 hypothetical protein [Nocardiopsis dassonvillei]VEI92597.1 Uncharacterised protein [Nocardiopsis dassonvillei]
MRTQAANGWQFFVATLLIVIGAVNVIQGLVALLTPEFYAVESTDVLLVGYTSWGVLLGLWGAVLIVAGLAVLSRSTWARGFALVLASVNAIAQLGFVMAMPLWSMVAIAVDLLVIYGLTAGWPDRERESGRTEHHEGAYQSGYNAAHAAPRPAQSPEGSTGSPQQAAGPQQTTGQNY